MDSCLNCGRALPSPNMDFCCYRCKIEWYLDAGFVIPVDNGYEYTFYSIDT